MTGTAAQDDADAALLGAASGLSRSTSVHATSPALLRAAISSVSLREAGAGPDSSSASHSRQDGEKWRGNVVVSHPPSPTSALANFESFTDDAEALTSSYRPFDSITPLNPDSLRRIPLSTPPRTPPPSGLADLQGNPSDRLSTSCPSEVNVESAYPLILVTGGCGFIGSHTVLEILQEGKYGVVVLDNLANSSTEVLQRVRILAAKYHADRSLAVERHPPLYYHPCDIQDRHALSEVFQLYAKTSTTSRIVSAIHFAALKSVSGSLSGPIIYYQVNVGGTLNLVQALADWNAKRLVFSSSCVVYGSNCDGEGITEDQCDVVAGSSKGITNPCECTPETWRILTGMLNLCARDFDRRWPDQACASDSDWVTMALRYTNPSGAHPSGYIGEDPTNAANLMPIVTQVLQGKRSHVMIYGADYDTPDGTGVRDFIHVVDLAKAHLAALRAVVEGQPTARHSTYNLGTNKGTSVLRVIEMLSLIAQRSIEIVVSPRRPGDLGCVVCSAEKAERELGWKAEHDIIAMCRDLVNWQFHNPNGYASPTKTQLQSFVARSS
ncbi:BZ3500_MvSof-1268-A1-R1_Chr3-2g06271 [Microbotryum saponariae]|uniref:BZ3500_MvSof-1268-A1-R1_Chr3-2g06271 protein n=1 Tax=Microbotryum saponariae TaxID=289078 RepID=A0A2X0MZI2_9BASI|nr:BZ3500_MvSof-1268-A1-R1_Chr3-2g06271 [Microbotryum saponariae]SDA04242.1 BZ3501_MvSof-1269-A2-R1_Chr3-2g05962 [Microbotryum saponariae]